MEIERKSLFTLLDISMDHFQVSLLVRDKFLAFLVDFFELGEEVVKKWSYVGKGIDYHTFKTWVAKDNRFNSSSREWPSFSTDIKVHYHPLENVLSRVLENSYEDLLHLYEALSLLVLFDKKCLIPRISYLNWIGECLELEKGDCEIIRESILMNFELSFEQNELNDHSKYEIYLSGMNMAYLSDELIDDHEMNFLDELSSRLGMENSIPHDLYFGYLNQKLSDLKTLEPYSLHKISAILLSLIGCDSSIDESEVSWFRKYLSPSDLECVRKYLCSDITKLIQGLSCDYRMLCYILGLEVSMADKKFHENEKYWLNELIESLSSDYIMSDEIFYIYLSVVEKNLTSAYKYNSFFLRPLEFYHSCVKKPCKSWKMSQFIFSKRVKSQELFQFLFEEDFLIRESDQLSFLIEFSATIMSYKQNKIVSKNFNTLSKALLNKDLSASYRELLISELLKISLLDGTIDHLEEDYLRGLQFKFNLSERMMHRVVFFTSFLLGKGANLRPHLNYNQI